MAKRTAQQNDESKASRRQTLLEGQNVEEEVSDDAVQESTEETPVAEGEDESAPETETPEAVEDDGGVSETEAGLLAKMKELGYQGEDENEAVESLLESYKRLTTERQQWEKRAAEQEELAHYGTEYLKSKREEEEAQARAAQDTQPTGTEPWWSPPTFDPKWLEQYRDVSLGEDGQPVLGWKANTPREVKESADKYQQYLEQWATDLVQRPQEVLPKIIEQEFDRLFAERIQERDEQQELTTFAERVRETNGDWMYTQDSQGRETLTPEGQKMTQILGQVAASGVTDPHTQWEHAVALYDYLNRAQQASAATETQQVQQTVAQKRRQQAAKGAGQPNRTGSVPRPDEEPNRSQNPHLSPGENLLAQLRQDGADI